MSKQQNQKPVNDQSKQRVERVPPAEHAGKIAAALQAQLEAEAQLGRAYLQVLGLAQNVVKTQQDLHAAHTRGVMSVGIDPSTTDVWVWDPGALAYVKQ